MHRRQWRSAHAEAFLEQVPSSASRTLPARASAAYGKGPPYQRMTEPEPLAVADPGNPHNVANALPRFFDFYRGTARWRGARDSSHYPCRSARAFATSEEFLLLSRHQSGRHLCDRRPRAPRPSIARRLWHSSEPDTDQIRHDALTGHESEHGEEMGDPATHRFALAILNEYVPDPAPGDPGAEAILGSQAARAARACCRDRGCGRHVHPAAWLGSACASRDRQRIGPRLHLAGCRPCEVTTTDASNASPTPTSAPVSVSQSYPRRLIYGWTAARATGTHRAAPGRRPTLLAGYWRHPFSMEALAGPAQTAASRRLSHGKDQTH